MERRIGALAADRKPLGTHRFAKALAREATQLLAAIEAARRIPAAHRRPRAARGTDGADSRHPLQKIPEAVHGGVDLSHPRVVVLQLPQSQRRGELVEAVLVAAERRTDVGLELREGDLGVGCVEVRGDAGPLVEPVCDAPLVDGPVVGDEHAALANRKALARHQAHRADIAKGAALAPLVQRAVRMGIVLDHLEPVAPRDRQDRIHVARMAHVVNHHDRLGARPDAVFDVRGVDAERVGVAIGKVDGDAQRQRLRRAGPIGHAGADDFVASRQSAGPHRRADRVRAIGEGEGVLRTDPVGELPLELLRDRVAAHVAAAQHLQNGRLVFGGDDGPCEKIAGVAGDCLGPAVDGQ